MTEQAAPGGMRSLIVLERQPFWEPELRRQFQDDAVTVRACRSVSDLEQLTTGGDCVVIANLADGPADLLRWLSRRLTSGRLLPVIVVTSTTTRSLQWHAREAGATALVSDEVGGLHMARLCRKQWPQRSARCAPQS